MPHCLKVELGDNFDWLSRFKGQIRHSQGIKSPDAVMRLN